MLLKKKEFLVCLHARGYENVMGFEEAMPDMNEQTGQSIKTHLIDLKLLERDPRTQEGYRFSAFAQVILDTIGKPEVWLEIHHLKMGIRRGLFLRNAFYVCVEEAGENVIIDILPSLPIFIGGYASLLKDIRGDGAAEAQQVDWQQENLLAEVCVCGDGEKLVLEIDQHGVTRQTCSGGVAFRRHTQESGTNAITQWILNVLRQMKEGKT